MRRIGILILATTLGGCGGGNVCNQLANLRVDCDDPLAEAQVAECNLARDRCTDADADALQDYIDCLSEGVERGECYVPNPEDPTSDPTAGCVEAHLIDANPACAAAVTSL